MSRDLGDFQTPLPLVKEVIALLTRQGKQWTRALEPTCGQGNFIRGILNSSIAPREIYGIEIQDKYVQSARAITKNEDQAQVIIQHKNIFDVNLKTNLQWQQKGPLLVIGNPPWVTNAGLSTLESKNLPFKTNVKGLRGLDAMTGESNFDIAECILLKLIHELIAEQPTMAFLCKTIVARNIIKFAYDTNLPITDISLRKINSQEHFSAAVDACLFCFEIVAGNPNYQAAVYPDLQSKDLISIISIENGQLISDIRAHRNLAFLDGKCPLLWRQGLKHDAASVVELTSDHLGIRRNKLNDPVSVEEEYVYPLLKSSDLGGKGKGRPKKYIIVAQRRIGENTFFLEKEAPHLWHYLTAHQHVFEQRKSSIYDRQPPFSIFGVGDYTFSPYKVAISGLYKTLKFTALKPIDGKPVILDDTCYFVACNSAEQAALLVSLLNHPLCYDFIQSIVFWDAKRPITKKLLQRIDLLALLHRVDKPSLLKQVLTELELLDASYCKKQIFRTEGLEELLTGTNSSSQITQMRLFTF